MTGTEQAFDACIATTGAAKRCRRPGSWQIPERVERPRCYQHALNLARSEGLRTLVDLRTLRVTQVDDIPRPKPRRFTPPTTYDAVLACLPRLRNLRELRAVIGVVIDAGPSFPGFGDTDSVLRQAIRDAKDRLKRAASKADVDEFGPGASPPSLSSQAVKAMRLAGLEIPEEDR